MSKKKPRSIGDLTRERPTLAEVFQRYMSNIDDRSAAIVGAADVEHALENAIRSKMVDLTEQERKRLFELGGAPLATFSAKVLVGHAIGVFGPRTRSDLDLIRDIRNAFAHASRPIDFNTPEVAAHIAKLEAPGRFADSTFMKGGMIMQSARTAFTGTCSLLQLSLPDRNDFMAHLEKEEGVVFHPLD